MKTLSIGSVSLALAAASAMIATSTAASAADIGHGEKLARDWCSNCHLVTSDQTSSGDSAPTFNSIAGTAAERSDDLRAWLADPHPPMPNFDLTVYEINDLLAYIESLRDQ